MEEKWSTSDGAEIKVKDMTTQHIINALKCLEEDKINFIICLGYAVDNDYIEYDEDISRKEYWIKTFKKELERRKLNG
jgi:hypothetical protein